MTDTPSAELDDLIADATIDAYDTSEQLMGFFNMIEEHLAVPFKTTILGQAVTVEGVMYDESRFGFRCSSNRSDPHLRQAGACWTAAPGISIRL